jgi:hypothetical protein
VQGAVREPAVHSDESLRLGACNAMQTYLTTNGTGQCIQAETLVNLYCYNFYHPQESPKARQDLPATSAPGPSQICTTPGGPLTAPAELSREMTLRQR